MRALSLNIGMQTTMFVAAERPDPSDAFKAVGFALGGLIGNMEKFPLDQRYLQLDKALALKALEDALDLGLADFLTFQRGYALDRRVKP
jgi:hypothetical protein